MKIFPPFYYLIGMLTLSEFKSMSNLIYWLLKNRRSQRGNSFYYKKKSVEYLMAIERFEMRRQKHVANWIKHAIKVAKETSNGWKQIMEY